MRIHEVSICNATLIKEISPIWHELHTKVESLLGSFNIQHIDNITEAIKTNIDELKI